MKGLMRLLAGGAMIAAAHAQSGESDLLPMPNTLPLVFFAPDSLAGTMLRPLEEPAEEAPGDGPEARAAVETLAQAGPAQTTEPAVPPTEPAPEPQTDPEPDAATLVEPPPATAEPAPAAPTVTTVHVIVENVESNRGTVNVAVCDTDLTPEGCPYKTSAPASQGFVEVVFDDVPPGSYAVVGYHDVNDNDEFDRFLSMPREPYALSGAAANLLIPDFSDAMLKINQGENYVIIRMKRLGSG